MFIYTISFPEQLKNFVNDVLSFHRYTFRVPLRQFSNQQETLCRAFADRSKFIDRKSALIYWASDQKLSADLSTFAITAKSAPNVLYQTLYLVCLLLAAVSAHSTHCSQFPIQFIKMLSFCLSQSKISHPLFGYCYLHQRRVSALYIEPHTYPSLWCIHICKYAVPLTLWVV